MRSPYSNEVVTTPTLLLTVTGLSANRTSPQAVGTAIVFSAIASGGIAPYQFKWWIDNGTTSTVGQQWSASNMFTWTPTSPSSSYSVRVWARNAGSAADAPANPGATLTMGFNITQTQPPSGTWTFCAGEGGFCAFTGTKEVRYGANGAYFYKTLTGGTACTNSVFGDPVAGAMKQCDIGDAAPPSGTWTFCAGEGAFCAFAGTKEVRYGANGAYFYKTLTGGTACTNSVFGDPVAGATKQCHIGDAAPPPSTWTFCAGEGAFCAFAGTKEVRYGANGAYFYKTLTGGTACTNSVFGDPVAGATKQCHIGDAAPPPSTWTFCAWEGGFCAFTGTKEVRYGANGAYFYKTLTGGTACTNSVFGDPVAGATKHCQIGDAAPPPSTWTFCAWEGGFCAFTGTKEVRYGANGSYYYRTLSGGTTCTNDVFGDPAVGATKTCDVDFASVSAPPTNLDGVMVYDSPSGSATKSGSPGSPGQTIQRALVLAGLSKGNGHSTRVLIAAGTYRESVRLASGTQYTDEAIIIEGAPRTVLTDADVWAGSRFGATPGRNRGPTGGEQS